MVNMRSGQLDQNQGRSRRPDSAGARPRPATVVRCRNWISPTAALITESVVAQRQQSTRQGQPSNFGAPSVVVQNLHEVATVRLMTRRGGGDLDQRPAQEARTLLANVAPSDMTRAGSFRRRQA